MQYKSSPATNVFKYVFPVAMLGGFALVFSTLVINDVFDPAIAWAFGLLGAWTAVMVAQLPFRLKTVETTEDGIFIKDSSGEQTVDYQDIESVSRFDLIAPMFVTITYRDRAKGVIRKICFAPSQKHQRPMARDAMSQNIIENIAFVNPDFLKENKSVERRNMITTSLLGSLVTLVALGIFLFDFPF